MKPFQSKGDGKTKRTQNRRSIVPTVRTEQDVDVKDEPVDNVEMVDIERPRQQLPATETSVAFNTEHEYASELYFQCDANYLKKEIKDEDECSKKDCASDRDAYANEADDPGDEVYGRNGGSPGPSSNSKGGKKKRKSIAQKPNDRKKHTNARVSKKAAVKRQQKHACQFCSYAASIKSNLTRHIRVHTGEKPFECEVCAKSFTLKHNLVSHVKTHGPRLTFQCSKCRQRFAHEIDKVEHENQCQHRHFECYACKYITPMLSHLKTHMQIHSGAKSFECPVCSKTFLRKAHLRFHSKIHVKQLRYECTKCGQRYAEEIEKQSHEKRCTDRRYECHLCPYECISKGHLKVHMRYRHTGEKPFDCSICGMKFHQKFDLKRHLARHVKSRPIYCIKCWKIFTDEGKKNEHEGQCNRRLYQCYVCKFNARYSTHLKYHMRVKHTGERPFACEFCEVRFAQKRDATRHMKRHHNSKN